MKNVVLYHATARKHLSAILSSGLRAGCYFTDCPDLAAYYEQTIRDEGDEPVRLEVSLRDLARHLLAVDRPGIEEPITTVLGMTEEEIMEEWEASDGTPLDCLEIIHSLRYRGKIHPGLITVASP